jgi:hypothetical protein
MGYFSPDLSTTGAAQTGFTTPSYTLVMDTATEPNSRQWVVTACGGTQTGARAHTAGDPFTILIRRGPYRSLPAKNPQNGSYGNVPLNRVEILQRKGVYIDSANTVRNMNLRLIAEVPAGAELVDPENIRAAVSQFLGLLAEEASDYGDTLITQVF